LEKRVPVRRTGPCRHKKPWLYNTFKQWR